MVVVVTLVFLISAFVVVSASLEPQQMSYQKHDQVLDTILTICLMENQKRSSRVESSWYPALEKCCYLLSSLHIMLLVGLIYGYCTDKTDILYVN